MLKRPGWLAALFIAGLLLVEAASTRSMTASPEDPQAASLDPSICFLRMQSGRLQDLQQLCGKKGPTPSQGVSASQARPAPGAATLAPRGQAPTTNSLQEEPDDAAEDDVPDQISPALTPVPARGIQPGGRFPRPATVPANGLPIQINSSPAAGVQPVLLRTAPNPAPASLAPQRRPDPDYEDGRY